MNFLNISFFCFIISGQNSNQQQQFEEVYPNIYHMQATEGRDHSTIFSSMLTSQNQIIDSKVALMLPKKTCQMSAQQKNEQFRLQSRNNYIQNRKRAARFSWNVQKTLQYLKGVNYKLIESEEVLDDAINEKNIQYLGQLVVAADPQFKTAIVGQRKRIIDLIKQKWHKPSSILLLGNLCAIYTEYARQANRSGLLIKLMTDMSNMKGDIECINIYSWLLTKMTMHPDQISIQDMQNSISQLYVTLSWAFSNQKVSSQICTNLMRLTLNFSNSIKFDDDFLAFLTTLKLNRQIDMIDLFLIFDGQIKKCSTISNSRCGIKIVDGILYLIKQIGYEKMAKSKVCSFFKLIGILVSKSQPDVAEYIIDKKFEQTIGVYCYGQPEYYKMIEQILGKMIIVANEEFLQKMRLSGIIDNLINDISDLNSLIGYSCLKIMKIIVMQLKPSKQSSYLQMIKSMGLQKEVEQFLSNINNQDPRAKDEAEFVLDIISSGNN